MTKKHDRHHDHCEHDLEHCGKCDVAYCAKCSKEWGATCQLRHASDWWTYTLPVGTTTTDIPYITTSGTCDVSGDTHTLTNHAAH